MLAGIRTMLVRGESEIYRTRRVHSTLLKSKSFVCFEQNDTYLPVQCINQVSEF